MIHQIEVRRTQGGWQLHCHSCHHRPTLDVPDDWGFVIAMEEVGQFLADHDAPTRICAQVIETLFPNREFDELVERLEQDTARRGPDLSLEFGGCLA